MIHGLVLTSQNFPSLLPIPRDEGGMEDHLFQGDLGWGRGFLNRSLAHVVVHLGTSSAGIGTDLPGIL